MTDTAEVTRRPIQAKAFIPLAMAVRTVRPLDPAVGAG